ncbi:MAG: hypothetical protein AB7R90_04130 [Reyranellaceae bacterium]
MSTQQFVLVTFNRGVVSPLALGRVDLERTRLSAETQTNWMPRALGSMSLRPGLRHVGSTRNDAKAQYIPFVFAVDDTALVELTDGQMRVLVDDAPVSRVAVSTSVTNGDFTANITTGWTSAHEAGASASHVAGGYLGLTGTRFNAAIMRQSVSVAGGDQGKEHALRIVVARGPVLFRLGSSAGGDDHVGETLLGTGVHSLAFTPTSANFHIQFANRNRRVALVDSVAVEGAGELLLPAPWGEAVLPLLRWDQSNDVIFLACEGHQQQCIERRARRSWSIVKYEPLDGPFRLENVSSIRLTPSALSGDITLTASAPLFRAGHVGTLFRIRSIGQRVELAVSGENQWTDPIRVTGVGGSRRFYSAVSGTWSGTVTIQRSVGEPGIWVDTGLDFTSNGSGSDNDNLDNQIVYYRIGIKTGDYTSGTANVSLEFGGGSIVGVVRINSVASQTSATAGVIQELGGTEGSEIWNEGAWSDHRGWPSAVAFYEGRLGWFGKSGVWQSISDTVDAFNPDTPGDSGPINRTIRYGSADAVAWAQAAQRLLVGTAAAELSIRSTSFDEPLTPTNYNVKPASTQGALRTVPAALMDGSVVFVQAGGVRVYELRLNNSQGFDYTPIDLTTLAPEIGRPGIVALAVQRQPDTRIHCVRADGKVAIAVIDRNEDVLAWVLFETDGAVEGAIRLPGPIEDRVYYVVRRVIEGQPRRYLERWALESECEPGPIVRLLDSHKVYENHNSATLGGLGHLQGKTVAVWADGAYRGEVELAGSSIVLDGPVQNAVVGLPYTADYRSAKLVHVGQFGPSLMQRKTFKRIGILARHLHSQSLRYGEAGGPLYALPGIEDGRSVPAGQVWSEYDKDALPVDGAWSTDSRIRLVAQAPLPATVLALMAPVEVHERV